jgi:putative ABC transport system permease protein
VKLWLEIVVVALAAIRANAMRSVLTTLGIVIGISAVIAMVALGEGAQRQVDEQISLLGANVLTVSPGQSVFGGVRGGSSARLTLDDAFALRAEGTGVMSVAPGASSRSQIEYGRYNSNNEVFGTWPEYFEMYTLELSAGRIFTPGELEGRRRVAVLGYNIPEELQTPAALLLGKTVRVNGQPFEVIGILAENGGTPWFRPDDRVFVPASTAIYRVFGGRDRLGQIFVSALSDDMLDDSFAVIDQTLRREHRLRPGVEADFNVSNAADLIESRSETQKTFSLLLAGIAGISLLVGGIGIMNIMLVSVTERTREIGVRKALGATRKAILLQFLMEALVLCTLGGALGILFGFGASQAMSRFGGLDAVVAMEAVYAALGFSVAIGLFFGIWPAQRAAKLDPIDALRYE